MTTVSDVLAQMMAAGMPEVPDRLEVTGRLRRFGRKKRGWYQLHEHVGRRGRFYVTGAFGYWGLVDGQRVQPAGDFSEVDRESMRREVQALAQREEERRRRSAAAAAMQSGERWRAASRDGSSAYLTRKGLDCAESIRFEADGTLLVPMLRYDLPRDQALVGVQAIRADGEKRFARGTAKAGAACRLGLVVEGAPILLAEGYATGMTVRMAVQRRLPVFVAFDAGNLEPVAGILRALHPRCPLLVCADDDWMTEGNPGRAKAAKLAKTLPKTHLIYPVWPAQRGPKETDFNDLHLAAGLHVVAAQLRGALQWLEREDRRAA